MFKRLICFLSLVCLVVCLFAACGKETITADQAWQIVLEDLGDAAEITEAPHIHSSTFQNQDCYNIFVTVDGEALVYVVSVTGQILHKGTGSHSH